MNFLSEFQSKFPSKYSGQYLETIIKSIANTELDKKPNGVPKILDPIFKYFKIPTRGITDLYICSEDVYSGMKQQRRVDLAIEFTDSQKNWHEIYVEIKVDDDIIKGKKDEDEETESINQLDDYLHWLAEPKDSTKSSRYFLILTAYPLNFDHLAKLKACKNNAKHMYLDTFCQELKVKGLTEDSVIDIFRDYLTEQGYVMNQLSEKDTEDFLSFMTLNFLGYNTRHGQVSSKRKISNGPIVFANLVKNWQLVSTHINSKLKTRMSPTIRYLPEQITEAHDGNILNTLTKHRMEIRSRRNFGRMWLFSEVVIKKDYRLTWGLVYTIKKGTKADIDEPAILCQNFTSLKYKREVLFEVIGKEVSFEKHSENIINKIINLIIKIDNEALNKDIYKESIFLNN
jgi:hypothetical protein